MVISWDFNGDLMGFHGVLVGLHGNSWCFLMGISRIYHGHGIHVQFLLDSFTRDLVKNRKFIEQNQL